MFGQSAAGTICLTQGYHTQPPRAQRFYSEQETMHPPRMLLHPKLQGKYKIISLLKLWVITPGLSVLITDKVHWLHVYSASLPSWGGRSHTEKKPWLAPLYSAPEARRVPAPAVLRSFWWPIRNALHSCMAPRSLLSTQAISISGLHWIRWAQ